MNKMLKWINNLFSKKKSTVKVVQVTGEDESQANLVKIVERIRQKDGSVTTHETEPIDLRNLRKIKSDTLKAKMWQLRKVNKNISKIDKNIDELIELRKNLTAKKQALNETISNYENI